MLFKELKLKWFSRLVGKVEQQMAVESAEVDAGSEMLSDDSDDNQYV